MKKIIVTAIATILVGNLLAMNCQRTVVSTANGEMKIELTITKDNVKGFARLSETLPMGSVIRYAKTEGGVFNLEDNKLKFIWMVLPDQKEIKVAYTIGTGGIAWGKQEIAGRFSYVMDGNPVNVDIPVTSFLMNDKKEIVLDNSVSASIAKAEPVLTSKTETINIIKTEPVVAATTKTEVMKNNANTSKLVYRIQIASSKEKMPLDQFNKYKFTQPVQSISDKGLLKYTTGEFKTLDEASKYKNEVSQKGAQGFILATLDGKVITIAEAKTLEAASK